MDCIAHGVTKSWTGLSNFDFHPPTPLSRTLTITFKTAFLSLPNLILHSVFRYTFYIARLRAYIQC